jgi:hypothetical protein
MTIRPVVLGAGLLVGVTLQAHAQAVQLRFHPGVGQVTHYRVLSRTWTSADTSAAPAGQMAIYQTQTVLEADSGTYLLKTVTDSTVMAGGRGGRPGAGGDMMRGMAVTVRMDARGHVLSTQVTPPPGLPPFVANMMTKNAGSGESPRNHVWPEGTIHPGDTWTDSMVQSLSSGRGRPRQVVFRMTYRFERLERQGGDRIAVISMNGAPEGGGSGAMTGEMALDLDASRMVRMVTDMATEQGHTRMTMAMLP